MKILRITLLIIFVIFSCSKNEDSVNDGQNPNLDQQQNENRAIPLSELNSGIKIEGSTTITGIPPAPTNNLDFRIDTSNQEAFQSTGFTIKFSSNDNFDGAYILFQDVNGNKSDNYFEVPISSIYIGKHANTKKAKSFGKISRISKSNAVEGEFEIEVDFDSSITPGQFCYEICLFDTENNISAIQKICVEVQAWGGDFEIVGEWIKDRHLNDYNETILCDNGETFSTIFYSNDEVNQVFVLNGDGSYYDYLEGFEEKLDYSQTAISCSAVYYEREYLDHKYSGNWAYNEDTNRITIVDFRYENFLDPTENQTYEDGLVYYGGNIITAVVVSGELIVTLDYYDPFEDTTHIFTWIYKRR